MSFIILEAHRGYLTDMHLGYGRSLFLGAIVICNPTLLGVKHYLQVLRWD